MTEARGTRKYVVLLASTRAGGSNQIYRRSWSCLQGRPSEPIAPWAVLSRCDLLGLHGAQRRQVLSGQNFVGILQRRELLLAALDALLKRHARIDAIWLELIVVPQSGVQFFLN